MRWLVPLVLVLLVGPSRADTPIRCDNLSTADLAIDGLLDDWPAQTLARVGVPSDGAIALRCSWDGAALAIALELADDVVVRTGKGRHDDHVTVRVSAGGRPFVVEHSESAAGQAFLAIAEAVASHLEDGGELKPPPRIVFED